MTSTDEGIRPVADRTEFEADGIPQLRTEHLLDCMLPGWLSAEELIPHVERVVGHEQIRLRYESTQARMEAGAGHLAQIPGAFFVYSGLSKGISVTMAQSLSMLAPPIERDRNWEDVVNDLAARANSVGVDFSSKYRL